MADNDGQLRITCLAKLLGISGVKAALEARANSERAFQTNWNTVCDWNETSRYDHLISEAKARDMLLAVADPKAGVGMAEDAMVKEQLTDAMIDAGAKLTSRLDETGLPVTAAFWLFVPDLNEWRLLFASPEVSSKGPRMVYEKIGRAVDELGAEAPSVPLSIVRLLDADADLPRLLKTAVRTGPGISRVRFSKNVVDGHFIEDALIYRAA